METFFEKYLENYKHCGDNFILVNSTGKNNIVDSEEIKRIIKEENLKVKVGKNNCCDFVFVNKEGEIVYNLMAM